VDEGRTEFRDLIGENADIAAGIEHGLVRIVDLASKQVLEALPPRAADARALNRRAETKSGEKNHRPRYGLRRSAAKASATNCPSD
jgi:hypothetical protein